jgi:hypothetical protein
MSNFLKNSLKNKTYKKVDTGSYIVDNIAYILYIPTEQDEHDYTMMKKKYPDVYKEYDRKTHSGFGDKVTDLVNAMRKVRGTKNWKDDEYIWFYDDDRFKAYYAVAPEWDQHDYSHLDHLDVKPISGAHAFPPAIDLLLADYDESDYDSDEDEKEAAKKEAAEQKEAEDKAAKKAAKKAELMRIRKENNERRKESREAIKAWNKSEKKEAKEAAKAEKQKIEKEAKEAAKKAKKEANEAAKNAAKAEKEAAKAKKAADKALAKANKVIDTIDSLKGGQKTRNNRGRSNRRTQKKKITK